MLNFLKKEPKIIEEEKTLFEKYLDLQKQIQEAERVLQEEFKEQKTGIYQSILNLHRSVTTVDEFVEITYRLRERELVTEVSESITEFKKNAQLKRIEKNLIKIEIKKLETYLMLLRRKIRRENENAPYLKTEIAKSQQLIELEEEKAASAAAVELFFSQEIAKYQANLEHIAEVNQKIQTPFVEQVTEIEHKLMELKEYGSQIGVSQPQMIYQAPVLGKKYEFISSGTEVDQTIFQRLSKYFLLKNINVSQILLSEVAEIIKNDSDAIKDGLTENLKVVQKIYQMALHTESIFVVDLGNWITDYLLDNPILCSNFIFIVRRENQARMATTNERLWLGICEEVNESEVEDYLQEDCLYFWLPALNTQEDSTVIVLPKEVESFG
ncbi:hypothetical protein [Enterococcus sp. LJL90]